MALSIRQARGVYYTPPEIARHMAELALRPFLDAPKPAPPRVLDPACGAGELLAAVLAILDAKWNAVAVSQAVHGIDIDPAAVEAARTRLRPADPTFSAGQVVVRDALGTYGENREAFDVIIANPPYVNIRKLAQALSPEQVADLRQRFVTAAGNFDLYVLFIEQALRLLRPGGRGVVIVPNKWATLDYARGCRRLLLEQTTIERVIDLSASKSFREANVYPHIVVFEKRRPTRTHSISFESAGDVLPAAIKQSALSPVAIHLTQSLDVERLADCRPLGEVATIHCGTAGYAAARIAQHLVEQHAYVDEPHSQRADFITSGNIDRFRIRLGNVRYINHLYKRPQLPLDIPEITAAKRRLFASPKIVIAGMSRRLEAAWDDHGLALGVQVFAIADCQLDVHCLLALLNSKLLTYLFATRFASKKLGGGYLAINKAQLAQLPVPKSAMASLAACPSWGSETIGRIGRDWNESRDADIDECIYRLYRLNEDGIARVEDYFVRSSPRAA